MDFEWITPEQAAAKWGVTIRQAQFLCANGKIDGVVKVSRTYLIPKDAPKPMDGRTKAARNRQNAGRDS
ncbi:MAG: helix-turn-helix domain-containing protein [Clostridiales Family XIII bacterium]|nr:helix-turn-helix domain-containing protein [Clostridiales Family XIII bacterium]